MKTLGVLLLLVICVAAGSLENTNSKEKNSNIKEENNNSKVENSNIKEENNNSKEKIVELTKKKKHPTIIGWWLSNDGRTSYLYLDDETWVEYLTEDKEHCKRYKTVAESENGYKIIKPLDGEDMFYLAVGEDKVLYRKKSYEFIESKGKVDSKGKWIHLIREKCTTINVRCANPCNKHKTCPGFKHAKCVPNTCFSCNGVKWIDKEVVVKCNKKPESSQSKSDSKSNESKICKRPFNCFADPCHVQKKCNGFPGAKCKADYCKGCFAKWTLHGKIVKCKKTDDSSSHQKSSESKSCEFPVKCFHNPCEGKKCKGHRKAKCKPDNCNKCQAKWTVGNKVVQCKKDSKSQSKSNSKSHSKSNSKSNESKKCHKCKEDPCDNKKCHAFPKAKCERDCKKCSAKWFHHSKEVSCEKDDDDFDSEEQNECRKFVKCSNPCENQNCLGNLKAVCKVAWCDGCQARWYHNGKRVFCLSHPLPPILIKKHLKH